MLTCQPPSFLYITPSPSALTTLFPSDTHVSLPSPPSPRSRLPRRRRSLLRPTEPRGRRRWPSKQQRHSFLNTSNLLLLSKCTSSTDVPASCSHSTHSTGKWHRWKRRHEMHDCESRHVLSHDHTKNSPDLTPPSAPLRFRHSQRQQHRHLCPPEHRCCLPRLDGYWLWNTDGRHSHGHHVAKCRRLNHSFAAPSFRPCPANRCICSTSNC